MEKFDFLKNKYVYLIMMVLAIGIGYYAVQQINILPKPGTMAEFIKFYFKSAGVYARITGISFLAFAAIELWGFGTILIGASLEDIHIAIKVIIIIVGIAMMLGALFFFSYFIMLVASILVVGLVGMIVLGSSSSSSSRRR